MGDGSLTTGHRVLAVCLIVHVDKLLSCSSLGRRIPRKKHPLHRFFSPCQLGFEPASMFVSLLYIVCLFQFISISCQLSSIAHESYQCPATIAVHQCSTASPYDRRKVQALLRKVNRLRWRQWDSKPSGTNDTFPSDSLFQAKLSAFWSKIEWLCDLVQHRRWSRTKQGWIPLVPWPKW